MRPIQLGALREGLEITLRGNKTTNRRPIGTGMMAPSRPRVMGDMRKRGETATDDGIREKKNLRAHRSSDRGSGGRSG
jgi:hypothetical protein